MVKNLQYLMQQQQYRIELLTSTMVTAATAVAAAANVSTPPPLPISINALQQCPNDETTTLTKYGNGQYRKNNSKKRNVEDYNSRVDSRNNNRDIHTNDTTVSSPSLSSTTATTSNHNTTVAFYISTKPSIAATYNNSNNNIDDTYKPPKEVEEERESQYLLYWNETYLNQLFQTYGNIRNIYLYRHKKKKKSNPTQPNSRQNDGGGAGSYKGDGIIVYKLPNTDSEDDDVENSRQRQLLIDLVCGQVRQNDTRVSYILLIHYYLNGKVITT